jgi:outer membrane protein assembly factor BamA
LELVANPWHRIPIALFNDRTGDIQLEGNIEYRFNVAPLFSNAILFKMALFADVGNIWNFKIQSPTAALIQHSLNSKICTGNWVFLQEWVFGLTLIIS